MRTIIDIPDTQVQTLKQLARKNKISRAEIVRQALVNYIAQHTKIATAYKKSFGIWKNRQLDSVDFQRKLRDEWR
jgi:metal-responsive CopG/Arc/MetJ family transcriptional regulator